MANDETKVMMTVPKDIIEAQVKAAVMGVLARDSEALVRAVVDAAMNQKRDSYNRQTIWEEKLNQMIRSVADQYLEAWIEQQKPAIHKALATKLAQKGTVGAIADGIIAKMSRVYVSLHLTDKPE